MKQARDTAYLYGLYDRGTLEVGKKADINVIDLDALAIQPPVHVHDLPTGTLRYVAYDTTAAQPSPAQPSSAHPAVATCHLMSIHPPARPPPLSKGCFVSDDLSNVTGCAYLCALCSACGRCAALGPKGLWLRVHHP
jgi:hypothetical protein